MYRYSYCCSCSCWGDVLQKTTGFVVAYRIGMKFGRMFLKWIRIDWWRRFLTRQHTFKVTDSHDVSASHTAASTGCPMGTSACCLLLHIQHHPPAARWARVTSVPHSLCALHFLIHSILVLFNFHTMHKTSVIKEFTHGTKSESMQKTRLWRT